MNAINGNNTRQYSSDPDIDRLYQEDLDMQIVVANREGDTPFLEKIFLVDKKEDILKVTRSSHWNWLHRLLLTPRPDYAPVASVNFYIRHGVPVNARDCYKNTPLHYAMRAKNVAAARALLEAGADPNIPDRDGATPLAYINGMPQELELLQLMLDKGADVNFFTGQHGILEGIKKYSSNDPRFTAVIEMMEKYDKRCS
ncbi:ankyrin repeat domain-containing protein [Cardiobacterium hominis]|uniref:ankyrin repeat domain-containing protein n=1 Tax=Cardiobacterium hominis TaxID=2718 RepID=UPI0028E8FD60|nr:ankyrin repeat domain-containing protein [Cardiobacterium hominis]